MVSRSHPGAAALKQARTTAIIPNALVAAHAKPDGPRLPSTKDAAADELISVVSADISTNPLSNEKEGSKKCEEVEFRLSAAEIKRRENMKLLTTFLRTRDIRNRY